MSMFDKRKGDEAAEPREEPSQPPPQSTWNTMREISASREVATLGAGITVTGDVTGEESLVINGTVNGSVTLRQHDLTIGRSGLVTASVKANVVRIEGEVTGDITGTGKVIITRTGKVRGDIVAPGVTLEDGAKFKGSIDMDPGSVRQQPAANATLKSISPGAHASTPPGSSGGSKDSP